MTSEHGEVTSGRAEVAPGAAKSCFDRELYKEAWLEAGTAAVPTLSLPAPPPLPVEGERPPATFREAREEYDRRLVAAALEQSGGSISEASRRLGISRVTLRAKMRRHGL